MLAMGVGVVGLALVRLVGVWWGWLGSACVCALCAVFGALWAVLWLRGLVGGLVCSVPLRVGGCDRGEAVGVRLRKSYEKGRKARKGYEGQSRHGRTARGRTIGTPSESVQRGREGAKVTHPYKQRLAFGGVLPSPSPCNF